MKIAVCEDEKIYSDLLKKRVEEYFSEHGVHTEISVFQDSEPLISSLAEHTYDIIFLDIQLENSDGMETAAAIRKADRKTAIIILSVLGSMHHRIMHIVMKVTDPIRELTSKTDTGLR